MYLVYHQVLMFIMMFGLVRLLTVGDVDQRQEPLPLHLNQWLSQ